jgi:hypothetical protein
MILLTAAGVACQASPSSPPARFSPASLVSTATTTGATPMFAVAPDGSQVLSWVAVAPGDSVESLQLTVTDPTGTVRRGALHDPLGGIEPHGEAPPIVAVGETGVLYALYTVGKDLGGRFPASALRLATSRDLGETWSAPVSVNEGPVFGSHNFHALLPGRDSTVHVAWLSSTDGANGVWIRSSDDGGRNWQPAHPIHLGPTCPCCRTGLALAPDGTVYASWRRIFEGDVRDVVVAASHDGGVTWDESVRPHADDWVFPGCPHAGPSLKVSADGVVHIAWWTGKAGEAGVWYARSSDGGANWQAQPLAVGEQSTPAHVQLGLADSGQVVVAYDDGLGARPTVTIRASSDGGRHFAAPVVLSDPAVAATFPVLALARGELRVAWTQVADAAYRDALAHRPDMTDPTMHMELPRVGQQEVWMRQGPLTAALP